MSILILPDQHEINVSELCYLKIRHRHCVVYENGMEPHICSMSIQEATSLLKDRNEFMQVNASAIINLNMVESEGEQAGFLLMKNGHYVKVDKGKAEEFRDRYKNGVR